MLTFPNLQSSLCLWVRVTDCSIDSDVSNFPLRYLLLLYLAFPHVVLAVNQSLWCNILKYLASFGKILSQYFFWSTKYFSKLNLIMITLLRKIHNAFSGHFLMFKSLLVLMSEIYLKILLCMRTVCLCLIFITLWLWHFGEFFLFFKFRRFLPIIAKRARFMMTLGGVTLASVESIDMFAS